MDLPVGATRLRDRPALKITTGLPSSSPPSPTSSKRRASTDSAPAISIPPPLLLSSSLPPIPPNNATSPNSRMSLLSSKDPLSIPIMTTNFKRFVSISGPVFWLQDRIEEIVLWKRGWLRTAVWMASYTFLCFYPRLLLLLPQIVMIGIILATYPYPPTSSDPLSHTVDNTPSSFIPPAEDSIPWQANIQAIQNLMGAIADLFAFIEPHIYHLQLHPSHLTSSSSPYSTTRPPSPYTPHILTLLVVSFPFLAFIISLPSFPIRGVFLIGGLLPFFLTHPWTRTVGVFVAQTLVIQGLPIARKWIEGLIWSFHPAFARKEKGRYSRIGQGFSDVNSLILVKSFLQRVMDDDRLSDSCWNAEMREVELWENERFGGSDPAPLATANTPVPAAPHKGWSKQNLKNEERSAWTRGRDGWSPVVASNTGAGMVENNGEISSNLTFSLAPGWAFVETEDWRKDLKCEWSGCGGGLDGWVYTNDAWLGPCPVPGGRSVTRRRRWVRRVWFDEERYKRDNWRSG